jgi:hypothetical protein
MKKRAGLRVSQCPTSKSRFANAVRPNLSSASSVADKMGELSRIVIHNQSVPEWPRREGISRIGTCVGHRSPKWDLAACAGYDARFSISWGKRCPERKGSTPFAIYSGERDRFALYLVERIGRRLNQPVSQSFRRIINLICSEVRAWRSAPLEHSLRLPWDNRC